MHLLRRLAISCSLLVVGCAEPPTPASIAIVTIAPDAEYTALPALRVEEVRSACGEGEACMKLSYPMATVLANGAVAYWGVAGRRPQLYRTTADTVVALGRSGSGPGEYRMPLALGATDAGEVRAADLMQRRILQYGPDGAVLPMTAVPMPIGVFDLAFTGGSLRAFAAEKLGAAGDSAPIRVFALEAGAQRPRELFTLPHRAPGFDVEDFRPMPLPFAAQASYRFRRDGHLFVAPGATFAIDEFDSTGVHLSRFGFDLPSRAVTAAELDAARERALRRVPDPRMREMVDRAMRTGAPRHPAITRLAPLDDGSLWVRESPVESADSVRWIVFASSARPRGVLRLGVDDMVHGTHDGLVLLSREGDERSAAALMWVRVSDPRAP